MLQNINTSKIREHINNPRKNLGDLTELADSIKQNGILQNLTVVKNDEGYTVIIGHRRLAAAKLVGLEEVPCSVVDMTPQEQIATMLTENMQREDLTVYEQAQGFQMMLDLGETVSSISEKTGFSDSTVRRRVKLLDLDQDIFEKTSERNVTLKEYFDLEQIESIELRNKVLEYAGTPNFNNELKKAVDLEKREKKLALVIEKVNIFAEKIEKAEGLRYVQSYCYYHDVVDIETPNDAQEVKYFYIANTSSYYWSITLYKEDIATEHVETDENRAAREERERKEVRRKELTEINGRAYILRQEFAKSISNTKAKKNIKIIIEKLMYELLEEQRFLELDYDDIQDYIGKELDIEGDADNNFDKVADDIKDQAERYLFITVYCFLEDSGERYYNWNSEYEENENLDRLYDFLEVFGYEMSDEEKAMRDGTHELFTNEEDQ